MTTATTTLPSSLLVEPNFFVYVPVWLFVGLVILFVVIIVASGRVTAYCGLICDDVIVGCMSGVKEGKCLERDVG
jgi:hypothetical protein